MAMLNSTQDNFTLRYNFSKCKGHTMTSMQEQERRRCSSNPFTASALERGGLSAPLPSRLMPRKDLVPIVQEA